MLAILLSPKHVSELIWVPPLSSDHFLPLGIIRELNLSVVYYYHKHQCHYALSQLPMMPGDAHYKAEHKKLTLPQQYNMMPTLPGRKGVGNHSHLLAPPNMAHILQVNCHSNPSEQPWWFFLFTEQERSRAVSYLLRHLGLRQWPSGFKTHADNSSSPSHSFLYRGRADTICSSYWNSSSKAYTAGQLMQGRSVHHHQAEFLLLGPLAVLLVCPVASFPYPA